MPQTVSILAVRPHPDDESSGTGGILARYANEGVRTGVVICTDGAEGEMNDPDLDPKEALPRLAEIRRHELDAAVHVLGVSELRLLGYRDSGMAGTDANARPEAFCNIDLDQSAGKLAGIIRELQPNVVVTENQNGTYGHPDHVRCHEVTVRAVELAADSNHGVPGDPWEVKRVFATSIGQGDWGGVIEVLKAENLPMGWFTEENRDAIRPETLPEPAAIVDVSDYVQVMRDALAKHRTQVPPDSFLMQWPNKVLRMIFGTAYYQLLRPEHEGPPLTDLLEGLR